MSHYMHQTPKYQYSNSKPRNVKINITGQNSTPNHQNAKNHTQNPKMSKFTLQIPKYKIHARNATSKMPKNLHSNFQSAKNFTLNPLVLKRAVSLTNLEQGEETSSPINKLYCRVPFSTSNLLQIGTKKMGSRALLLVKVVSSSSLPKNQLFCNFNCKSNFPRPNNNWVRTNCSTTQSSGPSLEPPDLPRLAQTARISLTPHEVSYLICFLLN